jgi:hypothetical protein
MQIKAEIKWEKMHKIQRVGEAGSLMRLTDKPLAKLAREEREKV